eukprot:421110-Prymnesium_polylepis.1
MAALTTSVGRVSRTPSCCEVSTNGTERKNTPHAVGSRKGVQPNFYVPGAQPSMDGWGALQTE